MAQDGVPILRTATSASAPPVPASQPNKQSTSTTPEPVPESKRFAKTLRLTSEQLVCCSCNDTRVGTANPCSEIIALEAWCKLRDVLFIGNRRCCMYCEIVRLGLHRLRRGVRYRWDHYKVGLLYTSPLYAV